MTNLKTTKRALFSSVLALLLCFATLLGTTFAWFTDTAVSANNKIVAGTLDVELYHWTDTNVSTNISDSHDPVFADKDANDEAIYWEPGMTQVRYLSIKNNGNLALKYKVALEVTDISDASLLDVMTYVITPDAKYGDVTAWAGNGTKVVAGANATYIGNDEVVNVELAPGAEHFFALSVHMDEEAGNQYMNKTVTFDIKVLAGQAVEEFDSFGNSYDALAGYPGTGFAAPITGNASAAEIKIVGEDGYKVGSVIIPKDAADPTATGYTADIVETTYDYDFTVATGSTATTYDITVTGLVAGNRTPVKASVRIEPNLDPATVKAYHYDTEIECSYDPTTGYVTFETTSFSPFTFVRDLNSKYEAPEITEDMEYPTAKVTYQEQYVNTEIEWGSYGQWSPTAGLDSTLEAAFLFECPNYDEATDDVKAVIDAYRYWYCDFFVSLDKDLGENEIFLGGNYGPFEWVGFHNGDLTLAANTELPLLSSIVANPWTYESVETGVGEFLCGVGDVDDALKDATFTVKLRLIDPATVDTSNPEWWADLSEATYVDVNTVTYTFGGNSVIDGTTVVTTGEGLQDAINEGATNIILGNDMDLSQGIVIPGN